MNDDQKRYLLERIESDPYDETVLNQKEYRTLVNQGYMYVEVISSLTDKGRKLIEGYPLIRKGDIASWLIKKGAINRPPNQNTNLARYYRRVMNPNNADESSRCDSVEELLDHYDLLLDDMLEQVPIHRTYDRRQSFYY